MGLPDQAKTADPENEVLRNGIMIDVQT